MYERHMGGAVVKRIEGGDPAKQGWGSSENTSVCGKDRFKQGDGEVSSRPERTWPVGSCKSFDMATHRIPEGTER